MSPNTLLNVKQLLTNNSILSAHKLDQLLDLLQRYNVGDSIYPGVIIRKLSISKTQAYDILDVLKKGDILQVNYELYCHECNQFEGPKYETIRQVPDDLYCDRCGGFLDPIDNSIVI